MTISGLPHEFRDEFLRDRAVVVVDITMLKHGLCNVQSMRARLLARPYSVTFAPWR